MWIKRSFEPILKRAAAQRPILLLTGARQTGKSALLAQIAPTRLLSRRPSIVAEQADRDSVSFLKTNPSPLIIDEVQYAPGIFRHLKAAVDRNRKSGGQYFLTGSQKFSLMKEVSESLAGRVEVIEIEPLSFSELIRHKGLSGAEAIAGLLPEFILRGGYPELGQ